MAHEPVSQQLSSSIENSVTQSTQEHEPSSHTSMNSHPEGKDVHGVEYLSPKSDLPGHSTSVDNERPLRLRQFRIDDRGVLQDTGAISNFEDGDGTHENHGTHSEEPDNASLDSAWTESTLVPRRNLGFVQCSSLMINQMIGTGIFTTPGFVLLLVKSKPICLVLWAVGGIYSMLSVFLYLEFGTALPYNGGALIYLDETFHHPELLASVVFSLFWILLSSTSGNCVTFAQYTLQLAQPDTSPSDFDDRLLRFIAIVVQTAVCLFLYFMRRFCFMVNNIFAVFKIILTLVIFGAGLYASRKSDSGLKDFDTKQPGADAVNTIAAMVYILYSYQGWEHTNYIAGEIRAPRQTLRNAAFFSVGLVTVLYMLVSTAYYMFATYAEITGPNIQSGVAAQLAKKVFGSATGINVTIALSAFSNLIANTYTTTKVKQAIAWQRFIPFYKFFGQQDKQFDSPGGALVLHWVFSVIELCIVKANSDAYAFLIGTFAYGYEFLMVFLGLGIFRLSKRMQEISETGSWRPIYLKNPFTLWTVAAVFIAMNLLMMVMTALPEVEGTIPRFWWPVMVAACIIMSLVYWAILKSFQMKFGGQEKTLGRILGFEVQVYNEGDHDIPETMGFLMAQAHLDGSRRRVSYTISGPTKVLREWWGKGVKAVKYYLE